MSNFQEKEARFMKRSNGAETGNNQGQGTKMMPEQACNSSLSALVASASLDTKVYCRLRNWPSNHFNL